MTDAADIPEIEDEELEPADPNQFSGPLEWYWHFQQRPDFETDSEQLRVLGQLERLFVELEEYRQYRAGKLNRLVTNLGAGRKPPRGMYIWGGVGRGKSLMMDAFYKVSRHRRKRRVHFHEFMREIHARMRALSGTEDPLEAISTQIAKELRLLCFDEFHVSDIADAMILGRLLELLVAKGVVFVMTSNYEPDGLYPNGLQRHSFLPTIKLLKEQLDVLEVDGGIDYRLRALEKVEVYHVPADAEGEAKMEAAFREISGGEGHQRPVNILERELPVLRRAIGVIWFDFATLCMGPRSQNDYLEIARRYHTVFLSGVPRLAREMANEARRFTWLVDVFYDHKVKLVMTAECEAGELYREGPQATEFQRTVSRLVEMRTRDYLGAQHRAE